MIDELQGAMDPNQLMLLAEMMTAAPAGAAGSPALAGYAESYAPPGLGMPGSGLAPFAEDGLPFSPEQLPIDQQQQWNLLNILDGPEDPPPPPPPTLSQLQMWARREEDWWMPQKLRMAEDDALFHLEDIYRDDKTKADEGTEEEAEFAALNECFTIPSKFANRIGRSDFTIQVPPKSDLDEDRAAAQEVENYCRHIHELWDRQQALTGGTMTLKRQVALSLALRGWADARLWVDDEDDELPVKFKLMDPQFNYKRWDARGMKRVLVIYETSIEKLIEDFPEAERELRAKYGGDGEIFDDWQTVRVVAYYDRWYHAVMVDDDWVKPPTLHGLGLCPWVSVAAQGSLFEGRYGEGWGNSWTRFYGDSVLAGIRDPFRFMVRIYSALATAMAKVGEPPAVVEGGNGQVTRDNINLGIAGLSFIPEGAKLSFPQVQPQPHIVEPLVGGVKSSINKAGIPDIAWGQDFSAQSGFARVVLNASADDSFFPIIGALEMFHSGVFKVLLEITKRLRIERSIVATVKGQRMGGRRFSWRSIERVGSFVECKYGEMSPQDLAAIASMVVQLVQAGVISYETAMSERFLHIDDPQQETQRKLKEAALFDPQVRETLIDVVMGMDPNSPIAQAWQQKRFQQQMMLVAKMAGLSSFGQGGRGGPGGQQGEKVNRQGYVPRQVTEGIVPDQEAAAMAMAGMP